MSDYTENKTLKIVAALQALTLAAVLAGGSVGPAAHADFGDRVRERPTPILPNAAAQRAEMIRLLALQVEEDRAAAVDLGRRLDRIDERFSDVGTALSGLSGREPAADQERP